MNQIAETQVTLTNNFVRSMFVQTPLTKLCKLDANQMLYILEWGYRPLHFTNIQSRDHKDHVTTNKIILWIITL